MSLPPPSSPCCVQILTEVAQGVRWSWWGLGWDSSGLHLLTPLPWVRGVALAAGLAPTSRSQGNLACWAPGQGPGLPGATGWRVSQLRPRHQVGVGSPPTCLGPLSSASMSSLALPREDARPLGTPALPPQAADGLELGRGSQLSGPSVESQGLPRCVWHRTVPLWGCPCPGAFGRHR